MMLACPHEGISVRNTMQVMGLRCPHIVPSAGFTGPGWSGLFPAAPIRRLLTLSLLLGQAAYDGPQFFSAFFDCQRLDYRLGL